MSFVWFGAQKCWCADKEDITKRRRVSPTHPCVGSGEVNVGRSNAEWCVSPRTNKNRFEANVGRSGKSKNSCVE